MRKFLLLITMGLFVAASGTSMNGMYSEYKCTLLNGDDGSEYTFNGKPYEPSLKLNFEAASGKLMMNEKGIETDNYYSVSGKLLTVKHIITFKTRTDTFIHQYEFEEKGEELIISEYKEGFNSHHFLKKHYLKKGDNLVSKKNEKSSLTIFTITEESPQFPGGPEEMKKFIAANVETPKKVKDAQDIEKVFLKLLISDEGKLMDVEIMAYPKVEYARAAMAVVKKFPAFKPALMSGKPVYVFYNVPVIFRH